MKVAAVIAECNPFHEGHAYLIRKLKEEAGADLVLLLLSGDFVQRGLPAVAPRRIRTSMALYGGADLVLSFPVRFCTSAAPDFASAGVRILDALGCVDLLGFGTDGVSGKAFAETAEAFLESENDEEITAALKSGASYPAAVAKAHPEYEGFLSGTGNVLALEYIRAIRSCHSSMQPYAVQRTNVSGSALRGKLSGLSASYDADIPVPPVPESILREFIAQYSVIEADDLSILLFDRLIRMGSEEELYPYLGMGKPLAHAVYRERYGAVSFTSLVRKLHTKDRTAAMVQRALLHVILDLKYVTAADEMLYTQILGFTKQAEPLLSVIGKNTRIPVIAKAAQAKHILCPQAYAVFMEDIHAAEISSAVRAKKAGSVPLSEFSAQIVRPDTCT